MGKPSGLSALYKPFGLWPHGLYRADNPSGFTICLFIKKPPNICSINPNKQIMFARLNINRDEHYCNCQVDEVQIFETALNEEEVRELYHYN